MYFEDNSIIICKSDFKKKILKSNSLSNSVSNYTFFTLEEFIKRYTFEITNEAVVYAMNQLGMSYKNTLTIIKYLYYIDVKSEYSEEDIKLQKFLELKNNLSINGKLKKDSLFLEFIKGKKIYVMSHYLDKYQQIIFKEIEDICEVIYQDITLEPITLNYKEFNKYNNEVEWVFNQILQKLKNSTDINKIFIINENKEYSHLLSRYSNLYKIPVYQKETESINNHYLVKEFLTRLTDSDVNTALSAIKEDENTYIINKIISTLNEFYFIKDMKLLCEILEVKFATIYYEDEICSDVVRVVDIEYPFEANDIVYLIGFNNKNYPKTYLDEGYFSDEYVGILSLTSTTELNIMERKKYLYLLSQISNLTVTYSKYTSAENIPSSLLGYVTKKDVTESSLIGLNKTIDTLNLGVMLDELINFNQNNPDLPALYHSLVKNYKKYNNQLTSLEVSLLKKKFGDEISLSYTSLSSFYKCHFKYYLEYVLHLKHKKDTSALIIGNTFHKILENYGKPGFDLSKAKEEAYNSIDEIDIKFYFNKLWDDFMIAVEMVDNLKDVTALKDEMHEKELTVVVEEDEITKTFVGKIDKIIYKEIDGQNYLAIIDYKTGKDVATLDNIEYGLELQLPIYAYLLAKTDLFANTKILGIYLNRILNDVKSHKTKDILTVKKDALKLDGYSISDTKQLQLLDPNYTNSSLIKNLSINKDESFYRYAKIFTEKDVVELIETVEKLIIDAFESIVNGNFLINPKKIKDENKSCKYCPYINICYRKDKDILEFAEKKFGKESGDE